MRTEDSRRTSVEKRGGRGNSRDGERGEGFRSEDQFWGGFGLIWMTEKKGENDDGDGEMVYLTTIFHLQGRDFSVCFWGNTKGIIFFFFFF